MKLVKVVLTGIGLHFNKTLVKHDNFVSYDFYLCTIKIITVFLL